MRTTVVIIASIVSLALPAAATAAPAYWVKYQLPAGVHDLPIQWDNNCGQEIGCFTGDTIEVDPSVQDHLFQVVKLPGFLHGVQVPLDEMVYLHELGHWFDNHYMTSSARGAFEAIAGTNTDWLQPPNSPGEKFAQAFALCALFPSIPKHAEWMLIVYGWQPSSSQQKAVCGLIDLVASSEVVR